MDNQIKIKNTYKFRVSGIEREVYRFKDLLNFVMYDYEVIVIENLTANETYAEQEKNLIDIIINYQKELQADLEIIRFLEGTDAVEINKMPYQSQQSLVRRKHRLNRGLFYIPTADAYTSTTLHQKAKEKNGKKRQDYSLYVTDIVTVVKKTMSIHNKTKVDYEYPYKINSESKVGYYIEDLYREAEKAFKEGKDFKLVNPRVYYSRETIRNINKIRKKAEDRV